MIRICPHMFLSPWSLFFSFVAFPHNLLRLHILVFHTMVPESIFFWIIKQVHALGKSLHPLLPLNVLTVRNWEKMLYIFVDCYFMWGLDVVQWKGLREYAAFWWTTSQVPSRYTQNGKPYPFALERNVWPPSYFKIKATIMMLKK